MRLQLIATYLLTALLARAASGVYSEQTGDLWIAGNDSLEIAISRNTGTTQRLLDKIAKEDYCDQAVSHVVLPGDATPPPAFRVGHRIGGLTLYDELRQAEFSDLTQRPSIRAWKVAEGTDAVSLSFEKLFTGAGFTVTETFHVAADHVRWDVRVHKTAGPDRTVRVIQFAPLPLGDYEAWAPVSDAPFFVKPYVPFAIEYGQSVSGPVGEGRWRTNIPMMVFYSARTNRALSFTSPFEVPAVRIRFGNNTSATSDFHWNSRKYPLRERPYFEVRNEYLGMRDYKDIQTGLLIASHPADWRPALGWVYSKYRKYFDPSPEFERWDGAYVTGYDMMKDSYTEDELRTIYAGRSARGARWEELHGHFPWYGLMIPGNEEASWTCRSHPSPGTTMTREKIAAHTRRTRQFGIGTFLYYNITESQYEYAREKFPDSISRDESGEPIGAFRASEYPDPRACWLMNADPSSSFGKHMIRQAGEMVDAYPDAAGFFWDVYGRSYMFDFAHDDGITMVNNKPAYYPEFMYQRMMREHVGPLLHRRRMCITANKPVTIASCEGLDGIMAMEDAPPEDNPSWIAAQSFLGLNRHVMIFEHDKANTELMFLHCLHYGMQYTDRTTSDAVALGGIYRPFLDRLRGKQWVFYPRALELPAFTSGNIFRLKDGSVMITIVSTWRLLRKAEGFNRDLEITCRLPDAAELRSAKISAVDLQETTTTEPRLDGHTLHITVPRHGKATVIVLSPT